MTRLLLIVALSLAARPLSGQQQAPFVPEDHRPPLFFRETWKDPEIQERKVIQSDLVSPQLLLTVHGPSTVDVRLVKHTSPNRRSVVHLVGFVAAAVGAHAQGPEQLRRPQWTGRQDPVADETGRVQPPSPGRETGGRPVPRWRLHGRLHGRLARDGVFGRERPLARARQHERRDRASRGGLGRRRRPAEGRRSRVHRSHAREWRWPGWRITRRLDRSVREPDPPVVTRCGFFRCARDVHGGVRRVDRRQPAGRPDARPSSTASIRAAQAERGAAAYTEHCSRCHRDNLRGNPEALGLTGTRFVEAWREDTLFSLFDHMATRMPREPLTTLPTPVYLDILAFILQFNGYPAGEQELTVEQLKAVRFVDKVGPQPLPNLALVRVVGCLTPGEKASWTLSAATEPVRDNAGLATTPEELRASADAPPGAGSFELHNLDFLPLAGLCRRPIARPQSAR